MDKGNNDLEKLDVYLSSQKMEWLNNVAAEFGIEAHTLAQIWIIERLKQLCGGHPLPPWKFQYATGTQGLSSRSTVRLNGILDNDRKLNRPLGVSINKTESQKLPWKEHLVNINLIINNNPYPAILRIYTGLSEFKSEGSYIRQDNRFNKDLDILRLNRLDPVKLEIDGVRNTVTII